MDFHNTLYQKSLSLGKDLADSLKNISLEELSEYESIGSSATLSSILIDRTKQKISEVEEKDVLFGDIESPIKLGDMYCYSSIIDQECMNILMEEADEKSRICLIEHFFVKNKDEGTEDEGTEEARQAMHEFLSNYLKVILNYYRVS